MHTSVSQNIGPPESAIFRCRSSRDDLCDEDPGIIADVRVICTTCYTKPQPWVTLRRHTHTEEYMKDRLALYETFALITEQQQNEQK